MRGEWSGRLTDGSVWIGSDADALLICRGEDRAERESEAVDLSVDLCSLTSPTATSSR